MKPAPELDIRARALRLVREALDQRAALDNQIGMFQIDGSAAAVGEKFETPNFIDDAALGSGSEKSAAFVWVTMSVLAPGSSASIRSKTRTGTPLPGEQ